MEMNRLYTILPAFVLALTPFAASAQDINSVVEVEKAYEGKLHEVQKPLMKMIVPDSLTRFNLDFVYDSFTSRYTSSYEFRPHLLDLKPNAQIDNGNRLFLKVGAGYTLHPTLDLVWSPLLKHDWKMNIYASHQSYVGNYYTMDAPAPVEGNLWNIGKQTIDGQTMKHYGHDLLTVAGIDTRHDWKSTVLMMDAAYSGLVQKDLRKERTYNAVDASLRFFSKSVKPNRFHYDFQADYRFAVDNVTSGTGYDYLHEHDFDVHAFVGPVVNDKHQVMFDMGVDGAVYRGALDAFRGNIFISTKYVYEKGRWDIAAGVKFSKLIHNGEAKMQISDEQYVYPDVNISFTAIKNGMDIYLKATGGNDINTYSSLLRKNHFADFTFGGTTYPLLNDKVVRVSTVLGLKGRITPYFSYDINGGYENYANAMFDAVLFTPQGLLPAYGYTSSVNTFAEADFRFEMDFLSVSVAARYGHGRFKGGSQGLFTPSEVEGLAAIKYNWHKRVYAGIDCEFATGRRAELTVYDQPQVYRIKGWADLGMYLEYKHTSHLSFWFKAGNLLFQPIQRNPFYAEKGGSFTIGLCLNM